MKRVLQQQYLAAMGIQLWRARDSDRVEEVPEVDVADAEQSEVHSEGLAGTHSSTPGEQTNEPPEWITEAPPPTDESIPPVDYDDLIFDQTQAEAQDRDEIGGLDWVALENMVLHCKACDLHGSRTNVVFGVGNRDADLMVIGEAPGADEDRQGEPFVGRAGHLLNAMLQAIGLKRDQVFIANILKCRPPGNRDPYPQEALRCEPYLKRQIALVRPRVILAVGRVAAQNLLKSEQAVGRLRGREIFFDTVPTVVTYHPAYLLRKPQEKAKAWQDLQRAVRILGACQT